MKALFAGLGGPDGGDNEGEAGLSGMMDDPEFAKIMQEMLKGDFAAAPGGASGAGAGGAGDDELQKLMAALGMSADDFGLPPSEGNNNAAAAPVASTSKAAPAAATTSASTTSAPPPPPPANFQDAIAASMSKLRDSSTTANASRAAASSSGAGGDSAGMAAMLAQLAGMPGGAGGGLPGLEGLDSDEGLQGMLDDMMKQLMSREMLYEPLKELADKVRLIFFLALSLSSFEWLWLAEGTDAE
jgi:peroxin-19